MSVIKNKRSLSKLEFYHNARKLRQDITNMLLRDFGVRDKVSTTITPENKDVKTIEGYRDWLITYFRESIMGILKSLLLNITAGNTIYPTTMDELTLRRKYQTGALVNCEQLLQEMIYCADVLPLKMEKLMPYVNAIDFEIKLLKGWRKSSNELAKKLTGVS